MQRTIIIAAALLVLQIGLAAALYFRSGGSDLVTPDAPFLSFVPDAVTSIEITGPEKERIVLQKGTGGWILPDYYTAPANSEQITALLARLVVMKQGFVVATSASAAKRFKVADDLFQRHVVLKGGDAIVGDFYVGTSPGFRQIHARKAGSEGVTAVELSTFELETVPEQWLDKNMMRLKGDDIETISFADFSLQKKDAGWQLENPPDGRAADAKAVSDLVSKVSSLTVQAVIAPQVAEPLFAATPALHYSITRKGGGSVEFSLVKAANGDFYVLKQSEHNLYCKVHTLQVEGLLKVNRDALLAAVQPAAGDEKPVDDASEKETANQ